jgi:hypothetical protein
MVELATCYRCGVDFDGTLFVPTAPCPDCQEDMPDTNWFKGWSRANLTPEVFAERSAQVKALYDKRLTDKQIAGALGISLSTATRWRRDKLNLPAHSWFPDEHWGPDARERMREGAYHTLAVRKPRSVKPIRSGIQAPNGRGFA